MNRHLTFTTTIERGDDELEVRVFYTVSPFIEATYWQPAEGGEVEITEATFIGCDAASMPAPFTDAEWDKLAEEAADRAYDDWAEAQAEAAEWRAQERRDRMLMERWEDGQ